MSTPQQHAAPVLSCTAGAVAHGHADGALEPAVLLHTSLPPGAGAALEEPDVRVDVHSDGRDAGTLTVRALTPGLALSWRVPVAPFVATLPGQLGHDGRMILLAVLDDEPGPAPWASPVDCTDLAAELSLPVADVAEALSGRLIPWLREDLDELLHLDAHDRAVDRSPAQTVADAVLAAYRGDLAAASSTDHLVRALAHAPEALVLEMAGRLSAAVVQAVLAASPDDVQAVRARTGPFESEVLRLLDVLPTALASTPPAERADAVLSLVGDGADRDEAVRAAVAVTAQLAREVLGAERPDAQVLRALAMVDDAGVARLSRLWVRLALAADGRSDAVGGIVADLRAEGPPGAQWLRGTASSLARLGAEVAGRQPARVAEPLAVVARLLEDPPGATEDQAVGACLALARYVRTKAGLGPAAWWTGTPEAAAGAVGAAWVDGLDPQAATDLLLDLLEGDVQAPELIDGVVCAASHVLALVDPEADPALRGAQVAALLAAADDGPRGARWLLDAVLREAPDHDDHVADLRPLLGPPVVPDPDRAAERAGRAGTLRAGLQALDLLAQSFAEEARLTRAEVLGVVLPGALVTHDLLLGLD